MAPKINHRTCRALAAGTLALAAGVSWMGTAAADPPGNNGTIKVDGFDWDDDPNNEPHVDCAFAIDFYDYGPGIGVDLDFYAKPPTGTYELIHEVSGTLDDDDNEGGDLDGHDLHIEVDLSDKFDGIAPHPQQGFHVKVTIDAPDLQGPDAINKHKVFWVEGCEEEPPPPPVIETTTTTTAPPPPSITEQTPTPEPEVAPEPEPQPVVQEQVLSASATQQPTEVLGTTQTRTLARTGSATGVLAALGGLLTAGGAGSLRAAARLRRK